METTEKSIASISDVDGEYGPNGGFEAILSAPTKDRDGDTFATADWKTPLPDKITVDVDHGLDVASTIGSAVPFQHADGTLRIKASFSSLPKAQEVRTLIQEGHIDSVSVACMTDRDAKKAGKPYRELLNAGVVSVPSNREAKILAYKDAAHQDSGPDKPYGNVEYADPGYLDSKDEPAKDGNGVKRYPLNTAAHVRAAWSYVNQQKNRDQYTAEQLAHIEDAIKAAAKKFGIEISGDAKGYGEYPMVTINHDDPVHGLQMVNFASREMYDDFVGRQLAQAISFEQRPGSTTTKRSVIEKAGARNSATDQKWIQAAHDASVMAGADCVTESAPSDGDGSDDGANKGIRKALVIGKAMTGSIEDLQCRIRDALCSIYDALNNGYPYVVATFLSDGGGTVVYELLSSNNGDVTLSRDFTDDGTTITLASEFTPVEVLTTVEPTGPAVNVSEDPDQDGDHDIRSTAEAVTKTTALEGSNATAEPAVAPASLPAPAPASAPADAPGDAPAIAPEAELAELESKAAFLAAEMLASELSDF